MKEQLDHAERCVDAMLAARDDRWYPAFHIAARAGWLNDPNGLCYFKGRYHVYFQHNPFDTTWGPMYWGHASSEDMVTWRREPIALAPSIEADQHGVFSGSAVVSDDGLLYVYYTGHRWHDEDEWSRGATQVQCLATSADGVNFDVHGVIIDCPEGITEFRDPKVWRTGDTWFMVVAARSLAGVGQIWLYTSADMVRWAFDRVLFEDPDPRAGMLECPDLFPLGDRWVLIYSAMSLPADGYRTRNGHNSGYVVGTWAPGEDFVPLTGFSPMDWGHQFYAPQTFEAPDGRRVVYGWMSALSVPPATQQADGWCGQLTVPRELFLDADHRLGSRPIAELAGLRTETIDFGAFELGVNEDKVLLADAEAAEIELVVDLAATTSDRVGLSVHKDPDGHATFVCYDDLADRVSIDRRLAAHGDRGYRSAPHPGGDKLTLRVLVDRGSVEVFAADGLAALSSYSFPGEGPRAVELSSESGTIKVDSLTVHRLGTIWADPDR
ncbi:MAG: glycoside hydrolase family 32 protein [Propioniciclava sp.]|uniref:glycoside hydrolase family 32 protein n=1 Tax=Propioniciclava sp. TaxID=2038686 RepID=UPI0039E25454